MVTVYFSHAKDRQLRVIDKAKDGCWIHVEGPDTKELAQVAKDYKLDDSLLMDALDPYESPRIEREDGKIYVFTRFCDTANAQISTLPVLIVYCDSFILTLTREQLPGISNFTQQRIDVLTTQKTKLLLSLLSEINTTYRRQLTRLSRTVLGVRAQLNKESISNHDFVRMIDIEEDLNEIVSALVPQNVVLRTLLAGKFIKLYEDDKDLIEDLSLGNDELMELANSRLKTIRGIREAYGVIMTNNLNRVIKLMTSITIIMTVPTIVSSIYGMNVNLPIDDRTNAFWIVIGIIVLWVALFAWIFRRNRWF